MYSFVLKCSTIEFELERGGQTYFLHNDIKSIPIIINKIKKAKTDPLPLPKNIDELVERPEAENLLGIYSSLKNQSLQNSIDEFSGKNFSEFKIELSDVLVEKIEPISKKIKELLNDEKYLDTILLEGSKKADIVASKKIKEIKELVGF